MPQDKTSRHEPSHAVSDHSDAPHVIAQLDLRDRLIKMIGYGRQVNPRRVVLYQSLESCAVQMLNQIGEVGRRASDAMCEKDGNSVRIIGLQEIDSGVRGEHVVERSPQAVRRLGQVESGIGKSGNLTDCCQLTESLFGPLIGAQCLQRYDIQLSIESLSGLCGNGEYYSGDPRARTAGDWLLNTCANERFAGLISDVRIGIYKRRDAKRSGTRGSKHPWTRTIQHEVIHDFPGRGRIPRSVDLP